MAIVKRGGRSSSETMAITERARRVVTPDDGKGERRGSEQVVVGRQPVVVGAAVSVEGIIEKVESPEEPSDGAIARLAGGLARYPSDVPRG